MGKVKDLTGQRFGRLTVLSFIGTDKNGKAIWNCRCDCGNLKEILSNHLSRGYVVSCGCYNNEKDIKGGEKRYGTRLYRIYRQMKQRCYNEKCIGYRDYGGRGIAICGEWVEDYEAFKSWALANGYNDNLTIDRIDNDKGYTPDNCRWETRSKQNDNTHRSRKITYNDETHSVAEWARITGIPKTTLMNRLNAGWPVEKALGEKRPE